MALRPNLGLSGNWNYIDSHSVTATTMIIDGESRHIPIPPFDFPLVLDIPTLAISVDTTEAKPGWKFGGTCGMLIRTGIVVGGSHDSHTSDWIKLWLGRVNVVRFPSIASDFVARFYVPRWFKDYQVNLFEYTGTGQADLEGKIDAVYDAIV